MDEKCLVCGFEMNKDVNKKGKKKGWRLASLQKMGFIRVYEAVKICPNCGCIFSTNSLF